LLIREDETMKLKYMIIIFMTILIIFSAKNLAFATNWQYVGTLSLSSGEVRKDYLDIDTIVSDKENQTITYWVLSEVTDAHMTIKTTKKYLTKLDALRSSKVLEWHGYDNENQEILYSKTPSDSWEYPEDVSLLSRAIDMAIDHIK
jgi:hypothetical protein